MLQNDKEDVGDSSSPGAGHHAAPLPVVLEALQVNLVLLPLTLLKDVQPPACCVHIPAEDSSWLGYNLTASMFLQQTAVELGCDLTASIFLQQTAVELGCDLTASIFLQKIAVELRCDLTASIFLQNTAVEQLGWGAD